MIATKTPAHWKSPIRVQWLPNLIREERRICLTRVRWEHGTPGDGVGHSNKVSVSLCASFRFGIERGYERWIYRIGPLRIHWLRAWGGIIP
jgi:hypothetical protein